MRQQLGSMTNTNHFTREFWEALGKPAPRPPPPELTDALDATLANLGAVRVALPTRSLVLASASP